MRSTSQYQEAIIARAKLLFPDMLWSPKTPQVDLISCLVSEFGRTAAIVEYVRQIGNLVGLERGLSSAHKTVLAEALDLTESQVDTLFSNDLRNWAEVIPLAKIDARKAKGPVSFRFLSAAAATIAIGTTLKSIGLNTEFVTIEDVDSYTPYLDDVTGAYNVKVMCEASVAGNDGNLVAGTRFVTSANIAGLTSMALLYDVTNGRDEETDSAFVTRIRASRQTKGVGSKSWLRSIVLADARVYDVKVYGLYDTGKFNRAYGADAWVFAEETLSDLTEKVVTPSHHVFRQQPLVDEDAVSGEGTTVGVVQYCEADSGLSQSVMGFDYAYALPGIPMNTVSYTVDGTIRDLQNQVEDPDNWLFGGRSLLLVKKISPIWIDTSFTYFLVGGYSREDVEGRISANLLKFFSGGTTSDGEVYTRKLIEVSIDKSDVLNVILDTSGVDRVDVSSFTCVRKDERYPGQDPIPINYNETARFGTVTLTYGG